MKEFLKQWWFWAIILILIIMLEVNSILLNNSEEVGTPETVSGNEIKTDEEYKVIKENPYKVTKDYDGIYRFTLNSDNGFGYVYIAEGAISFKNGNCEIQYSITNNSSSTYIDKREYTGFCGLNDNDNGDFYFTLKDNKDCEFKTYKCKKTENNIMCELKNIYQDMYDLVGCSNKELNLVYMDNVNNIDDAVIKIEEEKALKEEETFKQQCQEYTFEQMARNPEKFKGTNVKLTGEVIQTLYGLSNVQLRVNITKQGTYYTDTVYITYYPEDGEDKILENDIITLWGVSQGNTSYTSIFL